MQIIKNIIFSLLIFFSYAIAYSQLDYANELASAIMRTYKDSMVVKKFANHLLQDNQVLPGQSIEDAQLNRPAVWNYEMGVILIAFEKLAHATGNNEYKVYTKKIIDHFINDDGTIRTYVMEDYNLDNIPAGRLLLQLYKETSEEKYKKAAGLLYQQMRWQPRNKAGGIWHKLKYPMQMWLDGLYMGQPFVAEYANTFKDSSRFDDVVKQFILMEKYSRDPKTGLLYHGWDESHFQKWANPKTGTSPEFWSRAMGWYIMGLVDVLDYLPPKHKGRAELIAILNRLSTAIVRYQDKKEGVWWLITDKSAQPKNYLESSSSAMFVYGLAKAIRKGYINKNYVMAVEKGYKGIINKFIVKDSIGQIHYTQAISGAGLGGNPYRDGSYEYYVSEPKRDDDLKAIGPFIQACVEYNALVKEGIVRNNRQ
ncbi:MAG TPA: glycoside hydrolase family 88 protein [Chitinophagaceae bacterium]|nr:glycoside hydrolase family 88 protein [Chitinophagaceae bacterium]